MTIVMTPSVSLPAGYREELRAAAAANAAMRGFTASEWEERRQSAISPASADLLMAFDPERETPQRVEHA